MRLRRTFGAAVLLGALTLTGCGQQSAPATPEQKPAGGDFPVTVQAANGKVTVPARPERIISLAPTHTETLFAIGAGDQVKAVDEASDYPPEAPKSKLSGFKPNAEAVIAEKPDLVVVSDDLNGIVKALEKVKLPVVYLPAATSLDAAYDGIGQLGTATGHASEAKKVTDGMRKRIAASVDAAKGGKKLSYYHEISPELHSVTSKTFVGQIYGMFGLQNIADEAKKAETGFPQLTKEFTVKAAPDLIFLSDTVCCQQTAETVGKRAGWKDVPAVKNDLVVELDDSIASRWGPRLPEFVEKVGAAVQKAQG